MILLRELLGSPLEYTWVQQHDAYWRAEFFVNGVSYSVIASEENNFKDEGGNDAVYWEISFAQTEKSLTGTKTNSGGELQVFSTVQAAVFDFLDQKKPDWIGISSTKKEENRFNLYLRMINRLTSKLNGMGYSLHSCPTYGDTSIQQYLDQYETYCMRKTK